MVFNIVIVLMLAAIAFYFTAGPGARLLKKKSHHYLFPPSPQVDPNWIPIEIDDYRKYVFCAVHAESATIEDLTHVIQLELPLIHFTLNREERWYKITVLQANFSDFHQLVALCTFINEENVFGYCEHKTRKSEDYLVKTHAMLNYEYLIGAFRSNVNFGIHLPQTKVEPKGNLSKSPVREIHFDQEYKRLPIAERSNSADTRQTDQ